MASNSKPENGPPAEVSTASLAGAPQVDSHASSSLQPKVSQQPPKLGALARNNRKWDAQKQAIHQFYIVGDHTLGATMYHLLHKCGFKAR